MTHPSGPKDMVELTTCHYVKSRYSKQCCVRLQLQFTQSCVCEDDTGICDNDYNQGEDVREDNPGLESDFTDNDE